MPTLTTILQDNAPAPDNVRVSAGGTLTINATLSGAGDLTGKTVTFEFIRLDPYGVSLPNSTAATIDDAANSQVSYNLTGDDLVKENDTLNVTPYGGRFFVDDGVNPKVAYPGEGYIPVIVVGVGPDDRVDFLNALVDKAGDSEAAVALDKAAVDKDVADAKNHAQALASFTDKAGNSFSKGARGWADDAKANAVAAEPSVPLSSLGLVSGLDVSEAQKATNYSLLKDYIENTHINIKKPIYVDGEYVLNLDVTETTPEAVGAIISDSVDVKFVGDGIAQSKLKLGPENPETTGPDLALLRNYDETFYEFPYYATISFENLTLEGPDNLWPEDTTGVTSLDLAAASFARIYNPFDGGENDDRYVIRGRNIVIGGMTIEAFYCGPGNGLLDIEQFDITTRQLVKFTSRDEWEMRQMIRLVNGTVRDGGFRNGTVTGEPDSPSGAGRDTHNLVYGNPCLGAYVKSVEVKNCKRSQFRFDSSQGNYASKDGIVFEDLHFDDACNGLAIQGSPFSDLVVRRVKFNHAGLSAGNASLPCVWPKGKTIFEDCEWDFVDPSGTYLTISPVSDTPDVEFVGKNIFKNNDHGILIGTASTWRIGGRTTFEGPFLSRAIRLNDAGCEVYIGPNVRFTASSDYYIFLQDMKRLTIDGTDFGSAVGTKYILVDSAGVVTGEIIFRGPRFPKAGANIITRNSGTLPVDKLAGWIEQSPTTPFQLNILSAQPRLGFGKGIVDGVDGTNGRLWIKVDADTIRIPDGMGVDEIYCGASTSADNIFGGAITLVPVGTGWTANTGGNVTWKTTGARTDPALVVLDPDTEQWHEV